MIIVVSPSFEDHCVSTENPEADGDPQTKEAINQTTCIFMGMGSDVSVSVSLSVTGQKNVANSLCHKTRPQTPGAK